MATYFISDLHLSKQQPHLTEAFLEFLSAIKSDAQKLYILGDLFEFWIGSDAVDLIGAQDAIDAMKHTSERTDCYFLPGNRDFLIDTSFTEASGFTVLEDETVIDLYGTPTLLLHGDSLCTDDITHQQFRQEYVLNQARKQGFLALPLQQRLETAQQARLMSKEHKQNTDMTIMDVTEEAVIDCFQRHHVTRMIHGHTHRQHIHQVQIGSATQNSNTDADEKTATRIVLNDWGDTNSYLRVDANGYELINQKIQ